MAKVSSPADLVGKSKPKKETKKVSKKKSESNGNTPAKRVDKFEAEVRQAIEISIETIKQTIKSTHELGGVIDKVTQMTDPTTGEPITVKRMLECVNERAGERLWKTEDPLYEYRAFFRKTSKAELNKLIKHRVAWSNWRPMLAAMGDTPDVAEKVKAMLFDGRIKQSDIPSILRQLKDERYIDEEPAQKQLEDASDKLPRSFSSKLTRIGKTREGLLKSLESVEDIVGEVHSMDKTTQKKARKQLETLLEDITDLGASINEAEQVIKSELDAEDAVK